MTLDEVRGVVQAELGEVRTTMPGMIVEWDGTLATVVPRLPRRLIDGSTLAAPRIVRVPVCFPTADSGKCFITLPLKPGDPVLLSFSERSIEEWLEDSGEPPTDPRRFDLSDCFATPMMAPFIGVETVDTTNLRMQYADGWMTFSPEGDITIRCRNLTVNATQDVSAVAAQTLSMKANDSSLESSNNTVTSTTTHNGSVTVEGVVDGATIVTHAGRNLDVHVHTFVRSGTDISGPPA